MKEAPSRNLPAAGRLRLGPSRGPCLVVQIAPTNRLVRSSHSKHLAEIGSLRRALRSHATCSPGRAEPARRSRRADGPSRQPPLPPCPVASPPANQARRDRRLPPWRRMGHLSRGMDERLYRVERPSTNVSHDLCTITPGRASSSKAFTTPTARSTPAAASTSHRAPGDRRAPRPERRRQVDDDRHGARAHVATPVTSPRSTSDPPRRSLAAAWMRQIAPLIEGLSVGELVPMPASLHPHPLGAPTRCSRP
jgi:hypothetical protein